MLYLFAGFAWVLLFSVLQLSSSTSAPKLLAELTKGTII